MPTEAIQQQRELLCEGIQAFNYGYRRQRSLWRFAWDEVVIWIQRLLTYNLVSDMETSICICACFLFYKHFLDKVEKNFFFFNCPDNLAVKLSTHKCFVRWLKCIGITLVLFFHPPKSKSPPEIIIFAWNYNFCLKYLRNYDTNST